MLPVESPYKTYTGLDGKPLNNGYVYFGLPNQNPVTAPVTVYWDIEGTIPAAQPLRTVNGYIVRAGTPANVFVDGSYSELVRDSRHRQVFYAKNSDTFSLSGILSALANFAAATGSSLIGYIASGVGAVKRTVQDVLREYPQSVRNYGVKADGSTDDTVAMQNAANASKNFTLPEGSIVVTGTIQLQPGTKMIGAGMLKTRVQRKGVWMGPTFRIGTADGTVSASDCEISEMLIEQLHPGYVIGTSTTMVDRLTNEQGHIDCYGGYNAKFHNIWFQHGVYGLSLWGCVVTQITDIRSYGSWDNKTPAVCEQKAIIRLASDPVTPGRLFCTETRIERVYIGTGGPSPTRTITVGNITYQGTENIGSNCGIRVDACEGLSILNGYIGGCAEDGIQFVPQAITSQIRIDNMFFDESYTANLRFYPGSTPTVAVTIGPLNTFNGTLRTRNAIIAEDNAGQPSVIGMVITGGEYNNFLEAPIVLRNARAVTITGSMVNSYNVRGSTQSNATVQAGVFVSTLCREIHINGGLYGGGTNNWDYANNCKWGPYFAGGSVSGSACNVRSILGISGGATVGNLSQDYPT